MQIAVLVIRENEGVGRVEAVEEEGGCCEVHAFKGTDQSDSFGKFVLVELVGGKGVASGSANDVCCVYVKGIHQVWFVFAVLPGARD